MSFLSKYFKLVRLHLSLAISFSALIGSILYENSVSLNTVYVFIGVFLLSASASALNQIQERNIDALMDRTKTRPIPSKQITLRTAYGIVIVLGILGVAFLLATSILSTLLGIFNMLWYNAIYTPLKRKTTFAVLIGAVTGAVPPAIGWCAVGGGITDTTILLVAFFMFLWQMPHFWLLLIKFRNDYQKAGFAMLTTTTSDKKIRHIMFIWILSTSVSSLFFPLFHVISGGFYIVSLLIINAFIIWQFYKIAFSHNNNMPIEPAFRYLYVYQILNLIILVIG